MTAPLNGLRIAAGDGPAPAYAAQLLRLLGAEVVPDGSTGVAATVRAGTGSGLPAELEAHAAWASSGAMALTGDPDGPPRSPGFPVAPALAGTAAVLEVLTELAGTAVRVDGPALLGERAVHSGLSRQGAVSPGGSCRLLECRDGWLAVNLARPGDVDLLAAWLGDGAAEGDPWSGVADAVARAPGRELEDRAAVLGLPVGRLSAPDERTDAPAPAPLRLRRPEGTVARAATSAPLVVDLSSLWAGPLCAQLLGRAGARVVKVESTTRPDGARGGPASFFDLLHAGHASVALPLEDPAGRYALATLLAHADVVVDASRPRAMEQLGIDVDAHVRAGTTWVSITAHGRSGPASMRVGFGDDVGVAAGLVAGGVGPPRFCADAVADPVAGLHAAVGAVAALAGGGGHLVEVSMRDAVAATMGAIGLHGGGEPHELVADHRDGRWVLDLGDRRVPVASPRSRAATGPARPPGADTDAVLADCGIAVSWR